MSEMSEVCPGCGAEVLRTRNTIIPSVQYTCGAVDAIDPRHGLFQPTPKCLTRQLAQSKARVAELEAHLAAIKPVVQMAMEWERADSRHRSQQPNPGAGVYSCLVAAQHVLAAEVRSLPESERAWWEVSDAG